MDSQDTYPLVLWHNSDLGLQGSHDAAEHNTRHRDHEDGMSFDGESYPATPAITFTSTNASTTRLYAPAGQRVKSLPSPSSADAPQNIDIDASQFDINGWPQLPEELKSRGHRVTHALIDLVLGLVASLWLAFAIIAYAADTTVVNDEDTKLIEIARIGTTIFPYVFAAIVGRFLAAVARWRLEAGSTLSTIDQLYASSTLFSTAMTMYRHRALGIPTCLLAIVWSLSPVGSQATQRVVSLQTRIDNLTMPFSWANTMSPYQVLGTDATGLLNSIAAVQSSAMMAPEDIQKSAVDQWSNVKIPMIERLGRGTLGWIPLYNESTTDYSALIGIPVLGKDTLGASSFILNTTYWYANCFNLSFTEGTPGGFGALGSGVLINYTGTAFHAFVGNNYLWQIVVDNGILNSNISGPLSFDFQIAGFKNSTSNVGLRSQMTCNLTTSSVDVKVICDNSSNCRATAISYSMSQVSNQFSIPRPKGYTSGFAISQFFANIRNSFALFHSGTPASTAFERYLTNPSVNPFSQFYFAVSLSNTMADDYSVRLTQILNTYWLSSIVPISITSGLDPQAEPYPMSVVNSTRIRYVEVQYLHCNTTWLALLIIASTLLCLISFMSGVLKLFLRGPNILDPVSALTRPNVLRMPENATFLDGDERIRLMGHRRVRLGDVVGKNNSRQILIGDEKRVARLQENRPYV